MFASALIVFRETLEAAMIIAIIAVATHGVLGRGRWIGLGIFGGLCGAGLVAALAGFIANLAEGTGQELMNAGILLAAALMICWHVVWMSQHGKHLAAEMRTMGKHVAEGARHLSVLAIVIGMAVMREGSEVVLMLQGLFIGSANGPQLMMGAVAGLALGCVCGALVYAGLLSLPVGKVFGTSNFILTLIAGGLAARGVNFLVQAGFVPAFGDRVWDTSSVISEQSVVGQILAALVGYIAEPSGVQILAYGAVVAVVVGFLAAQKARRHALA